ncbi:hypothetical protein L7F22_016733 [Adiantum nelumboides]|nr:hypothetical protein [Adiantum nelumboides]
MHDCTFWVPRKVVDSFKCIDAILYSEVSFRERLENVIGFPDMSSQENEAPLVSKHSSEKPWKQKRKPAQSIKEVEIFEGKPVVPTPSLVEVTSVEDGYIKIICMHDCTFWVPRKVVDSFKCIDVILYSEVSFRERLENVIRFPDMSSQENEAPLVSKHSSEKPWKQKRKPAQSIKEVEIFEGKPVVPTPSLVELTSVEDGYIKIICMHDCTFWVPRKVVDSFKCIDAILYSEVSFRERLENVIRFPDMSSQENVTLRGLNLSYNYITDSCSATLSRVLRKHSSLEKLSLMENYSYGESNLHEVLGAAMERGMMLQPKNFTLDLRLTDIAHLTRARIQREQAVYTCVNLLM